MSLRRHCDRCGRSVQVEDGAAIPHGWSVATVTPPSGAYYTVDGRSADLCSGCRAHVVDEMARLPEAPRG